MTREESIAEIDQLIAEIDGELTSLLVLIEGCQHEAAVMATVVGCEQEKQQYDLKAAGYLSAIQHAAQLLGEKKAALQALRDCLENGPQPAITDPMGETP